MHSSGGRRAILALWIALTTGLAAWWGFHLVGTPPPEVPDAEVGEQATALEMKWSVEGVGDRFTPLPDPDVDMTFLPNLDGVPTWKTGVPLTTNSAGFRYPKEFGPKPPGTFRVVVLGDSFVASAAGRYEDGIAPQLEQMLTRALAADAESPERVEVYPIGIGGWNIISELEFLTHNLHRLEPDVVLHVVNANDLDSGFGFVLGNYRSTAYDAQRVFGTTYASIASPKKSQRRAKLKGLVGSYLIPESRRRYGMAAERIERLQDLLRRELEADYLLSVLSASIQYGLGEALRGIVPHERILLAPAAMRGHNLAPLDRHPNREGYRLLALSLAHALNDFGILPLREDALAAEGEYAPYSSLDAEPATREDAEKRFHVDEIPSEIRGDRDHLRPRDGARSVVGGVYRGAVLSPEAMFALSRPKDATHIEVEVQFPRVPALDGGTMQVWIDGVPSGELPMQPGLQKARLPLPPGKSERLVEVALRADRFYTEPHHGMIDGVFGYAPKVGSLARLAVTRD